LPLEKLYRIILILSEVNAAGLSEYVALRGGTAINLCFEQLPRLSIDIDLVATSDGNRENMLRDRLSIRGRLSEIVVSAGYELDTHFGAYALDRFELKYRNIFNSPDMLKIEINYIAARIPIYEPITVKPTSLFDASIQGIRTLSFPEVYGSKVEALLKRGAARDLFDIYMLARRGKERLELPKLRKCALFSCCVEIPWDFRASLARNPADNMQERQVRQDLHPFLRQNTNFELSEVRQTVGGFWADLFRLESDERQFLESLFEERRYLPALLFPDADHLKDHPGIAWRLQQLSRSQEPEHST
jgi:predicted nucleotidyltransferase component of viral defense system